MGINRVELVLSDGWFRGRNGGGRRQDAWGTVTAVIAQLEALVDGEPAVLVATDPSWTSRPGTITAQTS